MSGDVPPEATQLIEYGDPAATEDVPGVQFIVSAAGATVIAIVCEAVRLVPEVLSAALAVKEYEAGGGLGTVPESVMLLPALALGVSQDGRPEKVQL